MALNKRMSCVYISVALLLVAGCHRDSPPVGRTFDKKGAARANIGLITSALNYYRLELNEHPTTEQGLKTLLQPAKSADGKDLGGSWLQKEPDLVDPWGAPFQYKYPGTHRKNSFDLWSNGPDKKPNTDDDIVNWDRGQ